MSLPLIGFKYSTNQLFWLAAAPALSGATLRIFYSFMVPLVGGRRWTAISTASPADPVGIGFAVQDNTTAYPTMLILALLCGLGGNSSFAPAWPTSASSFRRSARGSALGVNAGLGNLGVSVVQFLSPLVVTAGIFGVFGVNPDHRQERPNHAGLDAERRLHLGAFGLPSRPGRLVWHE